MTKRSDERPCGARTKAARNHRRATARWWAGRLVGTRVSRRVERALTRPSLPLNDELPSSQMKRLYGSITRIAVSCLLYVSFIILYLQRRMHGTSLTIGLSRSCWTLRVPVVVQAPCASAIIECSNIEVPSRSVAASVTKSRRTGFSRCLFRCSCDSWRS